MASADSSTGIGSRCRHPARVSPRDPQRPPRVRRWSFPRPRPDLPTCVSGWLSGAPVQCRVAPPRRPAIRFLFVRSGFRLGLPPHPTSRWRRCLRL